MNIKNDFPYPQVIQWLYRSFAWCKPEGLSESEWANCLERNAKFLKFMIYAHLDDMTDGEERPVNMSLEDIGMAFNDDKACVECKKRKK